MLLDELVPLGGFQVLPDHLGHQIGETGAGHPAQLGLGLGGVAQQGFHFGGPEVAGVHGDDGLAHLPVGRGAGEIALFVHARAFPADGHAQFPGGGIDEVPHRVLHAGGDDKILGLRLLQHEPLHFHVVPGVAPVPLGVQVAQVEAVLQAELDAGQGPGDLAGDEGLAADGRLVVEEDAVAGVHAIGLPVVDRDPVGVELGAGVGAAGVEGGGFLLGNFLDQAEEFGGGGLVEPGLLFQTEDADGFEDAQRPQGIGIGGVFGFLEADGHVALGGQVVDLVGLHLLHHPDQVGGIGQIAIMQNEITMIDVRVLVEMINPVGIEQ